MADGGARLIIAPEVAQLEVRATYLVAELDTRVVSAAFEEYRAALCEKLLAQYSEEFVQNDPVLEGYRELRRRIGRSVRKYPCSTESLIGFLRRKGTLPSINLVVDIYNCVSLETRLTLGAHDLDRVSGNIHLRLAGGDEHFVPLGSDREEAVGAGEYCYIDDGNEVLCRLDYRQCDRTKLGTATRRCFFIIQGNPHTTPEDVENGKARLAQLLDKYCKTD